MSSFLLHADEPAKRSRQSYFGLTLPVLTFDSRFSSKEDSPFFVEFATTHTPATLLRQIVDREIPISMVIADKVFTSSEEAETVIHSLSKAAVELNLSKVVTELGMAEQLGSSKYDPLADVPEVNPVLVTKVCHRLNPMIWK